MSKGIILHRVSDAIHCVKNNIHKEGLLFSTHSAVDTYLREVYAIDCQCLSRFFSEDEVKSYKAISCQKVDSLLQGLDSTVSCFGVKANFFTAIYSYIGKYHYVGYLFLVKGISKIIEEYGLDRIDSYHYSFNRYLKTSTDMNVIFTNFFADIQSSPINYKENKTYSNVIRKMTILGKNILLNPGKAIAKIMAFLNFDKEIKCKDNRKSVLFMGYPYDLSFLMDKLADYNVIFYNNESRERKANCQAKEYDFHGLDIGTDDLIDGLFLDDIENDINSNIHYYKEQIEYIQSVREKCGLSLLIWGQPPNYGIKAAINEYLRSLGIPVIGAQHGCLYGESWEPWHFDSDFYRCDYFLSYGFTAADLKRLYPEKTLKANIVPVGFVEPAQPKENQIVIDILFPVTNSFSLMEGGMVRIPPDRLTERQIALLEYLDSLSDLEAYVKPFKFSTHENCSILPILKRLQNVKVIDYLTLIEFLEKYFPKAILIEYPSQTLFEVLHLDAEIFLMAEPIIPFERQALVELKRRVHYAEDSGEMIALLDAYFQGKIEKKRNTDFYNHYIRKPNREQNILRLIEQISEGHEVNL